MNITVIKSGYSIKQILIGKPTKQIEEWVQQLNENPLQNEEITIEECYSNKSLYDLQKFLEIE